MSQKNLYQEVKKLCDAVWEGYRDNWTGKYLSRKVEQHLIVCQVVLMDLLGQSEYERLFDRLDVNLDNDNFTSFKETTMIVFDDIADMHKETEMNQHIYILGLVVFLRMRAEEFLSSLRLNM